ncbi:MAG: hypothetical protein J3K34DRAFT_417737, partial [Monoraphidium minutum]
VTDCGVTHGPVAVSEGPGFTAGAALARQQTAQSGSLANLRRQLAAATAAACNTAPEGDAGSPEPGATAAGLGDYDPSVPIEMQRFLTEDDFARIRWGTGARARVGGAAMAQHGLSLLSKAKQRRLAEAAEEEAEEALAIEARRAGANEASVQAGQLAGRKKMERDQAGLPGSVLEGREGREESGSRSSRK